MRLIALLVIFFTYLPSARAAKISRLIRCLGKEELQVHLHKSNGPLYLLNQEIINLIAGGNDITLKEKHYLEICQNKFFSPSVAFLKEVLVEGVGIFALTSENFKAESHRHATLNEIRERAFSIFVSYLASLQAHTDDPHCLEKHLPEASYFLERYRYLEEDLEIDDLLADKNRLRKIFDRLQNFDQIVKACQKTSLGKKSASPRASSSKVKRKP